MKMFEVMNPLIKIRKTKKKKIQTLLRWWLLIREKIS